MTKLAEAVTDQGITDFKKKISVDITLKSTCERRERPS